MRTFEGLTLTEAREAYRTLLKLRRIADPGYKPNTHYGRWVNGGGRGTMEARPETEFERFARLASARSQVTLARVRAYLKAVWPAVVAHRDAGKSKDFAAHIIVTKGCLTVFSGYIKHTDTPENALSRTVEHYLRPTYAYIATTHTEPGLEYS